MGWIEEIRAKMEAVEEERRRSGYYNRHANCKHCGESFNLSERESSREPGYTNYCQDCSDQYDRWSDLYFEGGGHQDPLFPTSEEWLEKYSKKKKTKDE